MRYPDEPGTNDWPSGTAAAAPRRRRGCTSRRWSVLGGEDIRDVPRVVHRDRLRTNHRGHSRHGGVLSGESSCTTVTLTVASGGDVDELLRFDPSLTRPRPRRLRSQQPLSPNSRRRQLRSCCSRRRSDSSSGPWRCPWAVARRDRPRGDDFPRLRIDDVDCVLVLEVDEDAALAIAYATFGSVTRELHSAPPRRQISDP